MRSRSRSIVDPSIHAAAPRRRGLASFALAALAALALHCSLIAKNDLKAGLGEACGVDADCQNAQCDRGTCASVCGGDSDCPAPSLCLNARCRVACRVDADCANGALCVANACTAPLRIAALFPGLTNGEDGWSTSHRIGLDDAIASLPYARFGTSGYESKELLRTTEDIRRAIDQFQAEGAGVIVTTSPVGAAEALAEAPRYPGVKFIVAGATDNGALPNVGAYDAKAEQAWYVAGQLSARVADTGATCIGMVLPTPTKEIVRQTNAFVRGARFQQPDIKVVVRWLGATKDFALAPQYAYTASNFSFTAPPGTLFREELLAAQLADLGCTLVAHRTETQRVVVAVERKLKTPVETTGSFKHAVFSLGVDIEDACYPDLNPDSSWFPSCLGSVYWNWRGIYSKVFDQIHRGVWAAQIDDEAFRIDADAITKFVLSPYTSITGIGQEQAQTALQQAADKGFDAVFEGPYAFTGQRDLDRDATADANQSVAPGEVLSQDELARMCWFTEGTFELPDPTVVQYDSLVPALVPYGPPVHGQTTTLEDGNAAAKKKYGDVIDYVKSIGQDPTVAMSCALQ
jgi:basic membrane lipoprotein Med (substrate-binding protein (PBP1-ABC) superfamily)